MRPIVFTHQWRAFSSTCPMATDTIPALARIVLWEIGRPFLERSHPPPKRSVMPSRLQVIRDLQPGESDDSSRSWRIPLYLMISGLVITCPLVFLGLGGMRAILPPGDGKAPKPFNREDAQRAASAVSELRQGDPAVRSQAIQSLKTMGPSAIPCLIDGMLRDDRTNPSPAADILISIIQSDRSASLPVLLELLGSQDNHRRSMATATLGLMDYRSEEILVPLIQMLDDPEESVRDSALRSITRLGPAAKDALPHLRRLAGENGSRIQQAAIEAIRAIQ